MKTKNKNPHHLIKDKGFNSVTEVYFQINHLKQLFRQGWLRDIPEDKCESVADHCFGTAMLAILINCEFNLQVDIGKVVIMSITHELGEIYAGDITPFDGISRSEKKKMERLGMEQLFSNFSEKKFFISLWEEFEEGKTKEAKLAKQLDKLEMAYQAFIYEKQHGKRLRAFRDDVFGVLSGTELLKLLEEFWE